MACHRTAKRHSDDSTAKVCSRCHVKKPLDAFQADPRYRLGVHGWCRDCRAETKRISDARLKLIPKVMLQMKTCSTCNDTKPINQFPRDTRARDGHTARCKPCYHSHAAIGRMTKTRYVAQGLRERFGMTPDDVQAILMAQDGKCEICTRQLIKSYIDHNHDTLAVRGILCARCNMLLAGLEDDAFLKRAITYLARHAQQPSRFVANSRHWNNARRRQRRDVLPEVG